MIWDGATIQAEALEGGISGVDRTVQHMADRIRSNTTDPKVRAAAIQALRGSPEYDARAQAAAVYRFVRNRIRYQRDPQGTEWIQSAPRTLEIGAGDCDCQALLAGSLLAAGGVKGATRLSVVAVAPSRQPSHIFLEWQDPKTGRWWPMDSSWRGAGASFGWQPRFTRKFVYALPEGRRSGVIMASGSTGGQVGQGLGGFAEFFTGLTNVISPLVKPAAEIFTSIQATKTAKALQPPVPSVQPAQPLYRQPMSPYAIPAQIPQQIPAQAPGRIPTITEQSAIWWGEQPAPGGKPPAPAKAGGISPLALLAGGALLLMVLKK